MDGPEERKTPSKQPRRTPCSQHLIQLLGDLNADLHNLEVIKALIRKGWIDLGTEFDEAPTCFAPNAKHGTRRDYILANPPCPPTCERVQSDPGPHQV